MTQNVDLLQLDTYRSMTAVARFELAFDMSVVARQLAMSRLRASNPDWSEQSVIAELLRYAMLPEDPPWSRDD